MAVRVHDQDLSENPETTSADVASDLGPESQRLLGRAGAKTSESVERTPVLPLDLKPTDKPAPQGLLGRAGVEPSHRLGRDPILPRDLKAADADRPAPQGLLGRAGVEPSHRLDLERNPVLPRHFGARTKAQSPPGNDRDQKQGEADREGERGTIE